MLRFVMSITLACLVCAQVWAADPASPPATTPAAPAQPAASAEPPAKPLAPAAPAVKPAPQPASKPVLKPLAAPKPSRRTDFEVSGLTSETADQLYTRMNLNHVNGPKQWFVRAGYGSTETRSYSGNRVYETEISTFSLDSQARQNAGRGYRFVSAAGNVRRRSPHVATQEDKSGYYMLTAGMGRSVAPGLEAELALGHITSYDNDDGHGASLVTSLRWRRNLTNTVDFEGHAYILRPFAGNPLVDSRLDLSYKFTPTLRLRFTYLADNLLEPVNSISGWDRSFRVSLVFSRIGT